jgi:hypothetical protein
MVLETHVKRNRGSTKQDLYATTLIYSTKRKGTGTEQACGDNRD